MVDESRNEQQAVADALSKRLADTLDELKVHHHRVGGFTWEGNVIAFKAPDRFQARQYRAMQDGPQKPESVDHLAQLCVADVNGERDPVRVRQAFNDLLDLYPMMMSSSKADLVMAELTGLVEHNAALEQGKGLRVCVRTGTSLQTQSPNGPAASPEASRPRAMHVQPRS